MHPLQFIYLPLYKWPIHCPLLICHVFPCLDKYGSRSYCIISFFFPIFWAMDSACWSFCGMHIDLLFRSVLTSHAKGIRELCLPVLLCSQLWDISGSFTLLSNPWDNLYLKISASFSCLWFWLSVRVYLWTSIYFSDKGSNVKLLSSLHTDLCVIFTRTRPDCLVLKGQCLQNESCSVEDRRLISSKYPGNRESGGTKLFIEKRKKSRAGRLYV